ncbi:restriction endonuclease subunit S [Vibrio vulnificus]|uniref:restriction endonuclease subunit S n=1 Tax=Vibrio vulnificus TaxID=672 RepID=UPI0032428921
MSLNEQQKIVGMLEECHRDLTHIQSSMDTLESLTKESLLNIHLFKAINNEVELWLRNRDNNSVVTLASRNAFELYLIMLEVNSNEDSLKRFYAQLVGDRDDLNAAFMNKCKAAGYPIPESALSVLQEETAALPFENVTTRPFNMRNLADEHNYIENYNFFYKLSSKLIHPSALKVFGIENDSPQYQVVAMAGYYFVAKATDYAVSLYNDQLALQVANT